jgi:hypothetical protein
MSTAFALVALGVAWRLVIAFQVLPVPYNGVPLAAIALFAAARVPRKWALAVPVAILVLSDLVIDLYHGYPFYFASRLTVYGTFLAIAAAGLLVPRKAGIPTRLLAAAGGATFFFLVSNFAVWLGGEGFGYPMTLGGLMTCYAAGLPFYKQNLLADLVGTVALFGASGLAERSGEVEPAAEATAAR